MRKRLGMIVGLGCLLGLISGQPASAALNLSSDFASDNQGWTEIVDNSSQPISAPWNSGDITLTDDGSGPLGGAFIAPSDWIGDATNNYGGTLKFDLKSSSAWQSEPLIELVGPDPDFPILCFRGDQDVGTSFHTYSFTIDPSDAMTDDCATPASEQQIVTVLQSLSFVLVSGADDSAQVAQVNELDNVSLTGGSAPPSYDVARSLTLARSKRQSPFLGTYHVLGGTLASMPAGNDPECTANAKVAIYKQRKGPDHKVADLTSGDDSSYFFKTDINRGTYYAKSSGFNAGFATCKPAKSPAVKLG